MSQGDGDTDGECVEEEHVDFEDDQYEEDDDDNELYETIMISLMAAQAALYAVMAILHSIRNRRVERQLFKRRPITNSGYDYIDKILNDDPEDFRHNYRMYPDVFRKLCCIIRERTPLSDTRHICIEEMLATFLRVVGQNARYWTLCDRFGRSIRTISKNFNQILSALLVIAPQMMVTPGLTIPARIRESTRFFPYFKDCIGAMDGTHIRATVPVSKACAYRNRHGIVSQNVLAACNFDLEFIYVLSGWEGSAHDSKILNDALTRRNGLKVPEGKFYVVDCGFANRRQFLAPYRGVRYHLQDFRGEGRDPEKADELFNLRHASLRNVVERIFGVFKSRFTIFHSAPPFPYKTQAEMVLACAGLHNFLRKECRSDEFPVEYPLEPTPLPEHRLEDGEIVCQTQNRQRQEANEWRNDIAEKMWKDATGTNTDRGTNTTNN